MSGYIQIKLIQKKKEVLWWKFVEKFGIELQISHACCIITMCESKNIYKSDVAQCMHIVDGHMLTHRQCGINIVKIYFCQISNILIRCNWKTEMLLKGCWWIVNRFDLLVTRYTKHRRNYLWNFIWFRIVRCLSKICQSNQKESEKNQTKRCDLCKTRFKTVAMPHCPS